MVLDQHDAPPSCAPTQYRRDTDRDMLSHPAHQIISCALAARAFFSSLRRLVARKSSRIFGSPSHTPAVSPVPTPSKKARILPMRSLLPMAALTTSARLPAPAGPIRGRADMRFVK